MLNWIALGVVTLIAVQATITAIVALRRVERYKLQPSDVRALVMELESALEKMRSRYAREAMRHLRSERKEQEENPPPPPQPEQPADRKGELWALVHQRGIMPRPNTEAMQ